MTSPYSQKKLILMCAAFSPKPPKIAAASWLCDAMSVNMQGSLTLGKEVMDMLTQYVGAGLLTDGRRSMIPTLDYYTKATTTANLCENYEFCNNDLKDFIDEYVITLGKAVESIFNAATNADKSKLEAETIFGAEFLEALKEIKTVLKIASNKIKSNNEHQIWTGIVKKLSSKIQNRAQSCINYSLEGKTEDIVNIRKKLNQKSILAIIAVEERYLNKLCNIHTVCLKYIECTRVLNILLKNFKNISDKKTKEFIKAVGEGLEAVDFYTNIRQETANAFQLVLHEMSTTDNVDTKEVLLSVQKSVDARLQEERATNVSRGFDTRLINIILSDMDYMFSKYKSDPFHIVMSSIFEWQHKSDVNITYVLREVMELIDEELREMHDDIRFKLSNEVRVFLELTVEP